MYNLRDLTLLTSLASMGGLWAGLAGAVWQRTWVACRVWHPGHHLVERQSLRSMNPAGQAAGASLAAYSAHEARDLRRREPGGPEATR